MPRDARYPVRLDIFKLVPLGDPSYFTDEQARVTHAAGDALSVLPPEDPPRWSLRISKQQLSFTVQYYTATGVPIRIAEWEVRDGHLLCARTIDLFYPDGDPGRRVPFADVVTVTRRVYADGVAEVTVVTPIEVDECHVLERFPMADLQQRIPSFGDWDLLVDAADPPETNRFGIDALDEALALAKRWRSDGTSVTGPIGESSAGWRLPLSPLKIVKAASEIGNGDVPAIAPVIRRGAASILPLFIQADLQKSGRVPGEEFRRRMHIAGSVRDALELGGGRGIPVELESPMLSGARGSYIAALRACDVTDAQWWDQDTGQAVVLVPSGGQNAGTLALALHVVPASWVNDRQTGSGASHMDLAWSVSDLPRAIPRTEGQ